MEKRTEFAMVVGSTFLSEEQNKRKGPGARTGFGSSRNKKVGEHDSE